MLPGYPAGEVAMLPRYPTLRASRPSGALKECLGIGQGRRRDARRNSSGGLRLFGLHYDGTHASSRCSGHRREVHDPGASYDISGKRRE